MAHEYATQALNVEFHAIKYHVLGSEKQIVV
jgi:hypothetical protein